MQKTVMKKGFIIFSIIFLFAFIFFINQGSGAGGDPTLLPAVSINANPTSITPGGSSTLSWSATSGTPASCYKSWGGGFTPLIGSEVVYPTTTTTYVLTCINEEGESSASATVTVSAIPLTVSLTANPSSINQGSSSTLSWSSSAVAAECVGTGFFSGGATSGSVTVTPSSTITYSINCNDAVYNHVIDTATVQVIPTTYTLDISVVGTGRVYGNYGIDCSSSCIYNIPKDQKVTLGTIPTGGVFSGTNCGTDPSLPAYSCIFFMTGNKDVGVTFPTTPATPQIYVSANLNYGSITVGSSKILSFTVTNIGTGTLTGWMSSPSTPFSAASGDLSYELGAGESQIIPVKFAPTIAGTFGNQLTFTGGGGTLRTVTGIGENPVIENWTLTIIKSGEGTVTQNVSGTIFNSGTVIKLTAVPAPGSLFDVWEEECSIIRDNVCIVEMNGPRTVAVSFWKNVVTETPIITVAESSLSCPSVQVGSTIPGQCGSFRVTNTGVGNLALTASVNAPFSCTNCIQTISAGESKDILFTFSPTVATGGAIAYNNYQVTFAGQSGVTSVIKTISGTGTIVPVTTYPLTVTTSGSGTVTRNPESTVSCGTNCWTYNKDSVVTLTATPAIGYTITWNGCTVGTNPNTCTVTMTAAKTVTATFTVGATYTLTVTKTGTGSVISEPAGIDCGSTCSASLSGTVKLTASPPTGSTVTWGGACSGTIGNICTVTMTSDKTVTVAFNVIIPYTLTVNRVGSGGGSVISNPAGIDCGSTCFASLSGTVTLTATAYFGSTFTSWSGCTSTNGNICTVTMSSAKTVTATFTPGVNPPTCEITDASWSTSQVVEGTQVTMTATGNGYCVGWTVNFEVKRGSTSITSLTNNVWSANTISRTWTATPASSTLYYFIASVTTLGTSKTSGNLLVTALGEEPPVDQCLLVSFCSEYTSQTNCNADSCSVGGVSAPSTIDCSDPDVDCSCWWNTTTSSCSPLQTITSPIYGEGTCQITQDTADDCSDGFLSFSWTGVWDGNPAHESRIECETGGTDIIPCPAQIQLPFFSTYNVIAIIVIALLIYLIISARRKQGKSKSSKKRKR